MAAASHGSLQRSRPFSQTSVGTQLQVSQLVVGLAGSLAKASGRIFSATWVELRVGCPARPGPSRPRRGGRSRRNAPGGRQRSGPSWSLGAVSGLFYGSRAHWLHLRVAGGPPPRLERLPGGFGRAGGVGASRGLTGLQIGLVRYPIRRTAPAPRSTPWRRSQRCS